MEFMNLICPNSTTVWDGNGFSPCFDNIVLGFGLNVVTVLMIALLGITTKNGRGNGAMKCFPEKVLLQFLPAFGVCMSIFDMLLLWKKENRGSLIMYHDWLFGCSQFLVWATIIFFATRDHWIFIFCDPILSFWWIVKSVSWIPHLLKTFSSPEMEFLKCLQDSFIVVVDIVFSMSLNAIRLKRASSGRRKYESIENPLLSIDTDLEDGGQHQGNYENRQTFWKMMTFNSVTPMMEIGSVKQLSFEDLLQPPVEMDLSLCHNTLLSCWKDQESNNRSHPSLFMAICHAYGWPYFRLGLLKVFNDCFGFVGPLLLNKLIRYLQEGSGNLDGYVLAISLGLTSILKSFLDTQYTFHLARIKLKLRSSIMTVVYRKCLYVSIAERSAFSEGEIQTFMSVDADRTVNLCNSFHDMWSLPLQIGVALYLLYTQVKFAFISGVSITILLIPVNKWISKLIASATQKMMKQKDERIRRTGEFLSYIRTLKMYGWESLFSSRLMETRSLEVAHLSTRKYLDAWCVFFWATTPTLFSLFTFGLYALMGYQLDAATVFTCLALFNSLISPLNSFPWVINGLIDAIISMRRLSRLLSCDEHKRAMELTIQPSSQCFSKYDIDNTAIVLHDACCAWSSSKDQAQNLALNHVSLGLPKGSLIAIIGEVGSGKSSLLNSILGEMQIINGLISSGGSISYVPQVPWILSGTIRDNILFGKDYNPERYSDVLRACALDVDISLMAGGDMVLVGEKGVNLSGGQRARLALARAIYHSADIFILDDVLSAVDAQVGWQILNNAILGPLMGKHTRVLCTHNIQAISSANFIVVMDKGYARWFGSLSQFLVSAYSTFFLQELEITSQLRKQENVNTFTDVKQNPCQEIDAIRAFQAAPGFTEVEIRKEGKVELNVYRHYAAFAGLFITFTICFSAILMQASRNGNDLWLSHWVDATTRNSWIQSSMFFYVVVLCIFCLANSLFTLVRAFSFAFGGLRAAVQMHSTLLNKLSGAPVYFFDQTPGGRILNRLSSDLYTIDDSLPFILNILVANLVGLLGIAVVLSYVQVVFLLLLLPFWYAYNNLQSYYRSTSRELRRLDSVCRSPIYTSFTEALDGSTTIRAFNCEDLFLARFTEHVAMYQKTSYSELTASLWLSLRLQLLAAFVVSFVAIAAVLGSGDKLPISFGSPGLVGLALSYAAPIVSLLGSFLSSFAETEKEMVSVERVLQYMDIPQEQLQGCQCLYPNWPYQGEIKFQNVTLKYKPSLPPALHKVTFTIAGGTQVGIVGRTGAGKSSVLNALFCLNPICRGSIVVDGINVADVSVKDLRSCFAVVPQSPFLFEGSLRENLDPFNVSDDFKIWKALEQCHVREEVEAAGGLDMNVKESGTSFSVGQRQLLCLARAFLKSSKVLCLDECTANIDTQTASILQDAISRECRGMTVVTIAHRISTVLNMDSVLVFDRGTLVEEANPQVLLQDKFSRFSKFAEASTM